jgi:purine-binding chemotaxis protein CheW
VSAGVALKQIVAFRLGGDLFAADIFSVERVLRYTEPRSIPNVPDWIEGVIDYQSRVVPVIDMRKRFELEHTGVSPATRLLIFTIEGDLIGAIVDEVLDVMHLGSGRLSAPPAIFRGLSADFLLGMTRREERLVVVLDFARIFSTNERLVLEKVRDRENTIG